MRESPRKSNDRALMEYIRRAISVAQEITFGRAAGCTVAVPDDTFVSQIHARVFNDNGNIILEDFGSTNGTFVNGTRLTIPQALHKGDRVQIGSTVWSNRWAPNGDPAPAWKMAFDDYDKPVDHWGYTRWDAPAHLLLDVGVSPVGRPRSEGSTSSIIPSAR